MNRDLGAVEIHNRIHRRFIAVDRGNRAVDQRKLVIKAGQGRIGNSAPLAADGSVGMAEKEVANIMTFEKVPKSIAILKRNQIHQGMMNLERWMVHKNVNRRAV